MTQLLTTIIWATVYELAMFAAKVYVALTIAQWMLL
jgi:hypothetical protein